MSDDLSPEASAAATKHCLDAIAALLADDPDLVATPVKAVLIYEFMAQDGRGKINVFATDGLWSTEAIGFCEVGKRDLLDAMSERTPE